MILTVTRLRERRNTGTTYRTAIYIYIHIYVSYDKTYGLPFKVSVNSPAIPGLSESPLNDLT